MDIGELIGEAARRGASDVHLGFGMPPKLRIDGQLYDMEGRAPMTDADCENCARALTGRDMPGRGELDMALTAAGRRVRANLYRQSGHVSCALRILSDGVPQLETLGLPQAVQGFPALRRGIVLVTGETGSGKSTTLAAILQRINSTRREHIITLEDPVEYIYTPDMCLIDQREMGRDSAGYGDALRAALREDPDVLLIGEMRDLVTIETALTAAETGHLVFATLHTNSAADSIDRIVDVFPAERQRQARMQLSMTLQAVLSQQLLPRKGGGRAAACEVMVVSPAIRNLIREGKTPQIANAVATSADINGISMDNAVLALYRQGVISAETARWAARDGDYVRRGTQNTGDAAPFRRI